MYIYKNKIYVTDEINTMKIVRAMLNIIMSLYCILVIQYVSECSIVDQLSIDLCVMNYFCLLVFLLLLVYFTCLFYGLTK